jgi:hypothetical protein
MNVLRASDYRRLAARWQEYWHPRVVLVVRSLYADRVTDDALATYERIHRRTVERCIMLRLPWKTIIRYNLDDPTWDDIKRAREIAAAKERSRIHTRSAKLAVKGRFDANVLSD